MKTRKSQINNTQEKENERKKKSHYLLMKMQCLFIFVKFPTGMCEVV